VWLQAGGAGFAFGGREEVGAGFSFGGRDDEDDSGVVGGDVHDDEDLQRQQGRRDELRRLQRLPPLERQGQVAAADPCRRRDAGAAPAPAARAPPAQHAPAPPPRPARPPRSSSASAGVPLEELSNVNGHVSLTGESLHARTHPRVADGRRTRREFGVDPDAKQAEGGQAAQRSIGRGSVGGDAGGGLVEARSPTRSAPDGRGMHVPFFLPRMKALRQLLEPTYDEQRSRVAFGFNSCPYALKLQQVRSLFTVHAGAVKRRADEAAADAAAAAVAAVQQQQHAKDVERKEEAAASRAALTRRLQRMKEAAASAEAVVGSFVNGRRVVWD
jgi:hypothetical protein